MRWLILPAVLVLAAPAVGAPDATEATWTACALS